MNVPLSARAEAKLSLELKRKGYAGGTDTGFRRAAQLSKGKVDLATVRTMHGWFARHLITSRPGYLKWVADGRPSSATDGRKGTYRGAVAWLLWGGDPAYLWIASDGEHALSRAGVAFNRLPILPPSRTTKSPTRKSPTKKRTSR